MNKKKIVNILITIIYLITSALFAGSIFLISHYQNISFEQLLLSTIFDCGGTPFIIIKKIIFYVVTFTLPFIILLFIPSIYKKITSKELSSKSILITKIIIIFITLVITLHNIQFLEYFTYQFKNSTIYEEKYVNPNEVNITFNKKKNLIFIYIESMESTYNNLKIDNKDVSLIPELYEIAKENISFSENDSLGGAYNLYGTSWTKAADVATSAGVTTKINIKSNIAKDYHNSYIGVKTLGEILAENDYNNYLLTGCDPDFAATRDFYEKHGNYNITGFNEAVKKGYLNKSDYINWGIEDEKLLDIAKEELKIISQNDTPFNYTIFTIDTHFPGYVNPKCDNIYKDKYANSISCQSLLIKEFIDWIQKQDFFDNTTIVITGDHLAMESKPYLKNEKNRRIYNAFINSEATKEKYNRAFSNLDMYPTVLASIGAEIEGNRLGLGVNLFSDEKTIIEEYGYEKIEKELKKNSKFYNNNILKKSK